LCIAAGFEPDTTEQGAEQKIEEVGYLSEEEDDDSKYLEKE